MWHDFSTKDLVFFRCAGLRGHGLVCALCTARPISRSLSACASFSEWPSCGSALSLWWPLFTIRARHRALGLYRADGRWGAWRAWPCRTARVVAKLAARPGPGLRHGSELHARHLPFSEVLAEVFYGSGECAEVEWSFLGLSMPGGRCSGMSGITIVTIFVLITRPIKRRFESIMNSAHAQLRPAGQ